ncbi:hypothetical protein D3C72_1575190 [compost metagenome]
MADIGDVVEDQTAVAVDFADDLGRRGAQAADDQRHLLAHDGGQVGFPAVVQRPHDLIDAKGRDPGLGVLGGGRSQALADFGDPVDQGFLRAGVQRREGADDAAAALLDHHVLGRGDEQRRPDDRKAKFALQACRNRHFKTHPTSKLGFEIQQIGHQNKRVIPPIDE